MQSWKRQTILVDAHVHIHECFDLPAFLDSAFENFRGRAEKLGELKSFTAILTLAEQSGMERFQDLRNYADKGHEIGSRTGDRWTLHHTDEDCSLFARSVYNNHGMFIIAGRQIVSAEDLELLTLCIDRSFKAGMPLQKLLREALRSDAVAVIPWGPGKWLGRRGALLKSILIDAEKPRFFLGDNSGRPVFWPRPSLFRLAESKGIRTLPGSDPLPFPSECGRAGSFGFSVRGTISPKAPALDLRRIVHDPAAHIVPYGRFERPAPFFRNQLSMQLMKRKSKKK
jgi:hypothetical protein